MKKYHHSPLLTDLYQLTMAAGYWHSGMADREAVFHLFFRSLPFDGGYAIAAGLEDVVDWLQGFLFDEEDIAFLSEICGKDGSPLFKKDFLAYLSELEFSCDVDAIEEGTVVFAHQPLLRIKGPLLQAQLIETALLNIVNFQTLIATKSARICQAAQGEPVLEFGLRRAQGPDGGLSASRAAFIGGCAATSNVLAGKELSIPVRGTHAHSWVMSFADEALAFSAYAEAMPNNCVLLVDTYDTIEGVRNAIVTGRALREAGYELSGIRLDSGDLAWLSIEARRLLDEAGFNDTTIVASNDLDEHLIESLKHQGAQISVWGVGTNLVTGGGQAALGGVYKLGALKDIDGEWQPKIKLSDDTVKVSSPGMLQVRRYSNADQICADAIYDEMQDQPDDDVWIIDPTDPLRKRQVPADCDSKDLLTPLYRDGKLVGIQPSLLDIQAHCRSQLERLNKTVKRLDNPHRYPAGLTVELFEKRAELIEQALS